MSWAAVMLLLGGRARSPDDPGKCCSTGERAITGFVPRTAHQAKLFSFPPFAANGGPIFLCEWFFRRSLEVFLWDRALTTIFGRLLLIAGLLHRHVARIEMVLAIQIFSRSLLIRVLAVW